MFRKYLRIAALSAVAIVPSQADETFYDFEADVIDETPEFPKSAGEPDVRFHVVPGSSVGGASPNRQVLTVVDENTTDRPWLIQHTFPQTTFSAEVSFSVRFEEDGADNREPDVRFCFVGSPDNPEPGGLSVISFLRARLNNRSVKGFTVYDQTAEGRKYNPTNIESIGAGEWYKVTISADLEKGRWRYSIVNSQDQSESAEGELPLLRKAEAISRFEIVSIAPGGKVSIDDLRIKAP